MKTKNGKKVQTIEESAAILAEYFKPYGQGRKRIKEDTGMSSNRISELLGTSHNGAYSRFKK